MTNLNKLAALSAVAALAAPHAADTKTVGDSTPAGIESKLAQEVGVAADIVLMGNCKGAEAVARTFRPASIGAKLMTIDRTVRGPFGPADTDGIPSSVDFRAQMDPDAKPFLSVSGRMPEIGMGTTVATDLEMDGDVDGLARKKLGKKFGTTVEESIRPSEDRLRAAQAFYKDAVHRLVEACSAGADDQ